MLKFKISKSANISKNNNNNIRNDKEKQLAYQYSFKCFIYLVHTIKNMGQLLGAYSPLPSRLWQSYCSF